MNIQNIHSYNKVIISNDKADIYMKIAGGASCLTRYEIIVGKLHICKQNDINLPQSKNHNL